MVVQEHHPTASTLAGNGKNYIYQLGKNVSLIFNWTRRKINRVINVKCEFER